MMNCHAAFLNTLWTTASTFTTIPDIFVNHATSKTTFVDILNTSINIITIYIDYITSRGSFTSFRNNRTHRSEKMWNKWKKQQLNRSSIALSSKIQKILLLTKIRCYTSLATTVRHALFLCFDKIGRLW